MKKLKGIKPINNYLNKWLKAHDFECTAELDTDFSFDGVRNVIYYSFVVPESHDVHFIDVCRECREEIGDVDTFILSFFHELGHYETEGMFEEKEWKHYDKLCRKLRSKGDLTLKDCNKYWHDPIEYEATMWACDYIIDNFEEVKKWWSELQPLIMNFMKLNKIENK